MKWIKRNVRFSKQRAWLSECGLFMVVETTYRNGKRSLWRRDGVSWRHVGDYARGEINGIVSTQPKEPER